MGVSADYAYQQIQVFMTYWETNPARVEEAHGWPGRLEHNYFHCHRCGELGQRVTKPSFYEEAEMWGRTVNLLVCDPVFFNKYTPNR